ncbi:MAG: HAMP domain-containing histidine kinase [Deltaproteobacteria bacterium]|nr:HAMP domain-containing histidine kinase [Deltaproteobacteria bacterium]
MSAVDADQVGPGGSVSDGAPAVRVERSSLLRFGLAGLALGYLVLSPLAMVFFHLAHRGMDPQALLRMHHSLAAMVLDSFSPAIPIWWFSFAVLGGLVGLALGGVVSALRVRERRIALHARQLAAANAELEAANLQLKEAYQQVLQADKMASLGLMAGTVVHDINGYVQAVMQIAEEELDGSRLSPRSDDPWSLVLKQALRMRELADSVRRFARRSSGTWVKTDVRDPLREACLMLDKALRRRGVELVERLDPSAALITGNPNELLQVFVNLIQNALDAMPHGGRLTVETRLAGGRLEVSLADTGVGIPVALQERIFESFFTTKDADQGTGLGLAICRRIVESHHGSLQVESEEGRGATFRISLPLTQG